MANFKVVLEVFFPPVDKENEEKPIILQENLAEKLNPIRNF